MKKLKRYYIEDGDKAVYLERNDGKTGLSFYKDKGYFEFFGYVDTAKYAVKWFIKHLIETEQVEEDGFAVRELKELLN